MGKAADNDYCPHCGRQDCSASCYYGRETDGDENHDSLEVQASNEMKEARDASIWLVVLIVASLFLLGTWLLWTCLS